MSELTVSQVANGFQLGVGLIIFILFVYVFLSRYFVDSGRQKLFEARDRLFDYWLCNQDKVPEPLYRGIRDLLNGSIRFAHKANFSSFLAFVFVSDADTISQKPSIFVEIDQIQDKEARKFVRSTLIQTSSILFGTAVLRSPLALLLLIVVAPFIVINQFFSSKNRIGRRFLSKIRRALLIEAQAA